jgi:ubiquinone/menaquinone biosynthesis C-methylase UbiE
MEFLNPEKILDKLELHSDMVAADFGCGSGGFTIPLAKKLEDGLVYALDIQEAPLSALKSRALLENITNFRIIRCDLEKPRGSTLPDSSLDLVLVPNVLFQAKDKSAIISEAKRILKKGGRLLAIDWVSGVSQGPTKGRVSAEEVKKIAKNIGLELEKEFEAGKYHFGLVFKKG